MNVTVTDFGTSFIDLVRRTRKAQKDYYRTKDYMFLRAAKELEQELDAQLDVWETQEIWEKARKTQPELFPAK
jgi:hypothetical protein